MRIQLAGEGGKNAAAAGAAVGVKPTSTNPLVITRQIIAQDGVRALYKGWSAALLRQVSEEHACEDNMQRAHAMQLRECNAALHDACHDNKAATAVCVMCDV